jgi:hypothetical protein
MATSFATRRGARGAAMDQPPAHKGRQGRAPRDSRRLGDRAVAPIEPHRAKACQPFEGGPEHFRRVGGCDKFAPDPNAIPLGNGKTTARLGIVRARFEAGATRGFGHSRQPAGLASPICEVAAESHALAARGGPGSRSLAAGSGAGTRLEASRRARCCSKILVFPRPLSARRALALLPPAAPGREAAEASPDWQHFALRGGE